MIYHICQFDVNAEAEAAANSDAFSFMLKVLMLSAMMLVNYPWHTADANADANADNTKTPVT